MEQEPYSSLVKQILARVVGVVSIYLYGSQVHKIKNAKSDFDLQIILATSGSKQLNALREIEIEYGSKGYNLGIMTHIESEIFGSEGFPAEIFVHRNRCWFFIKDMKEHARLLWGKDIFSQIDLPPQEILIVEATRVLHSLVYEARKKFVNKPKEMDSSIDLVKYCLYASQYFCVTAQLPNYEIEAAVEALASTSPRLAGLRSMLELKRNNYAIQASEWQRVSEEAIELLEYFSSEASIRYAEYKG